MILILIVLCLCGHSVKGLNDADRSLPPYEHCQLNMNQRPFDVLPGAGWDNLANIEMGRILEINFTKCHFSHDNNFLIPNQLTLIPKKESNVEISSELFTHFSNYTSVTSKSINVEGDLNYKLFKIGGSFSDEKEQIKNDQLNTKSLLSRVQMRYNIFQSMFEPDTPLFPTFKNRIMDIAGLIIENKDSLYPKYLADLIVRDYGTHIIRSIVAGALLSKTDALNEKYVSSMQSDMATLKIAASASYFNLFNINSKYKSQLSEEKINEYNTNVAITRIKTYGGDLLGSNLSIENWEKTIMKNLVAIDRRGEPLHYVITARTLPELDDETLYKLTNLIKEAIDRFVTRNTRKGCMDFRSTNYNPDANVDSGNCENPNLDFTFGGVYQRCDDCSNFAQTNPLTGDYSCPSGFQSLELVNGIERCYQTCSGWIWETCETHCNRFYTYWCYANGDKPNLFGYQFGGIFFKNCPIGFIPLQIGLNTKICVTPDPDPKNPNSIKFGGFYSCNVGNPLAKDSNTKTAYSVNDKSIYWPNTCAKGYTSHILSIEQDCQISYCTETNKLSLGSSPPLIKPPFIKLNYNPNSTKVTIFSNIKGEFYAKDQAGTWRLTKDPPTNSNNKSVLIGSIIGSVLVVICVCLVILFIQRRHYLKKIKNYRSLPEFSNPTELGSTNNINQL